MCSMDSSVVEHRTFNPTVASSTLAPNPVLNAGLACHASSYASCSIGDLERSCQRGLVLLPSGERALTADARSLRPAFGKGSAAALPEPSVFERAEPALPLLRPLAKGPSGDLVLSSGLIVSPRTPHDERPDSSTSNHLQHRKGQPRALVHWKDYRNDDFSRQDPRANPRSDF